MVEGRAGYGARRESGWSVDRTTAIADRSDKAESNQGGVWVEKEKVIEASLERIRTI